MWDFGNIMGERDDWRISPISKNLLGWNGPVFTSGIRYMVMSWDATLIKCGFILYLIITFVNEDWPNISKNKSRYYQEGIRKLSFRGFCGFSIYSLKTCFLEWVASKTIFVEWMLFWRDWKELLKNITTVDVNTPFQPVFTHRIR